MLNSRFFEKNRNIQERWFRIKFHQKFGRQLKTFLLWRLHRRLEKEFIEKDEIINAAIDKTVISYKKVNKKLFPATQQLFNIGLFFLLAERDVQALKADAFAHPNETKRNIALRSLLLTIYEWDMGKVTGRKMNFIYESTGLSSSTRDQVVTALRDLKNARKTIEKELSEARHNTIAHREANALQQYEIMSELNIMKFSATLTTFYKASDMLLKSLIKAMHEIGTMESLFYQVTYKNDQDKGKK
ncbi:MAG: hypothetical protein JXR47_02225 [Thiotrichales bacterium]|nr:hypothetical protein [Thiotrichales bacterium]